MNGEDSGFVFDDGCSQGNGECAGQSVFGSPSFGLAIGDHAEDGRPKRECGSGGGGLRADGDVFVVPDPNQTRQRTVGTDEPCIRAIIRDATKTGDALLRETVLDHWLPILGACHAGDQCLAHIRSCGGSENLVSMNRWSRKQMRLRAKTSIIGDGRERTSHLNQAHVALAQSKCRLGAQRRGKTATHDGGTQRLQANLIPQTNGRRRAAFDERLHRRDGAARISDGFTIRTPLAQCADESSDHRLPIIQRTIKQAGIDHIRLHGDCGGIDERKKSCARWTDAIESPIEGAGHEVAASLHGKDGTGAIVEHDHGPL